MYDFIVDLYSARTINGCSKYKTYNEIYPLFKEDDNYSYDQLRRGLIVIGQNIELILTKLFECVHKKYGYDLSKCYIDGTNIYVHTYKAKGLKQQWSF